MINIGVTWDGVCQVASVVVWCLGAGSIMVAYVGLMVLTAGVTFSDEYRRHHTLGKRWRYVEVEERVDEWLDND